MREGNVVLRGAVTCALALAALGMMEAPALAQVTDNFEGAGGTAPDLGGWTFTAAVGGVGWKVDGLELGAELPAGLVGPGPGGPTFAGAGSLNYNDDTDYENGATNTGTATSPVLVVTGAPVTVTFQCNYDTEEPDWISDDGTYDIRSMAILDGTSGAVLGTFVFCNDAIAPQIPCPGEGAWHAHVVDITATLGAATSFRIQYGFDTTDAGFNTYDGWFVDNLSVTNVCIDTIAPSTPTLLLPADASTVPSPPGVVLDWTDSTDTSTCGPSGIANYVVEVGTTNPPVVPFTYSSTPAASTDTTPVLGPGTYFWRVRAVDVGGLPSPDSAVFSFTIEPPLVPGLADTLHVNESVNGAQSGQSGFVDPVIDEQPVFSAIYRDPNSTDFALGLRFQVSTDPTFTLVDFDSGAIAVAPPLPKDGRCTDLSLGINLARDTVYFWRIQFTDAGGLTGPFSLSQSFRIGDDFDFGVRPGSSNHSRKCFVASASFGSGAAEVGRLAGFREDILETSVIGRAFSRTYAGFGPGTASVVQGSELRRGATRAVLAPLAAAASCPPGTCWALLSLLAGLAVAAFRRL
ncbi:MAG: hypothetical protein HYY18_15095 [Planctomycetes bacterium]|nr:hypothetical protein [Planctomycetota bacterium]